MYNMSPQLKIVHEDEEDDDLGMKMSDLNVIAYDPGTKVRILKGKYAGETGTVQNATRTFTTHEGERSYWVHLDWDEDPQSAIVYRQEELQRIVDEDADEDSDFLKEIGEGYPRFEYQTFGSAYRTEYTLVKANEEFIGTISKTWGKVADGSPWHINYVARRKQHTYIPISSPEEGAQQLWQEHTGLVELPVVHKPYEPLEPIPDDPRHYEGVQAAAHQLIQELVEDDWEEDDSKEYGYDQLTMIVQALQQTGFKVTESRVQDGIMSITFLWPYVNATGFIGGWKRAQEAIKPYINLRDGNYEVNKGWETKTAVVKITKSIEDNPGLWKIKGQPVLYAQGVADNPVFFDIFYNDQKVGRAYLPAFNGSKDIAERMREEMVELDKIAPFNPGRWPPADDNFGHGPAITWWRKNRSQLKNPKANKYYFDRSLLAEPEE